ATRSLLKRWLALYRCQHESIGAAERSSPRPLELITEARGNRGAVNVLACTIVSASEERPVGVKTRLGDHPESDLPERAKPRFGHGVCEELTWRCDVQR